MTCYYGMASIFFLCHLVDKEKIKKFYYLLLKKPAKCESGTGFFTYSVKILNVYCVCLSGFLIDKRTDNRMAEA